MADFGGKWGNIARVSAHWCDGFKQLWVELGGEKEVMERRFVAINKVAHNQEEWVGGGKSADVGGCIYLCLMEDEVDWGDEGVHLEDVVGSTMEPSCDGSDGLTL